MSSLDLSDFSGDASEEFVVDDEDPACVCEMDRHELPCFEHFEVVDS